MAEDEIIELLVKASSDSADCTLQKLQDGVKTFLTPWVSVYCRSIVGRLLDSKTTLAWDGSTNNCQQFCDSLINWQVFGPLLSQSSVTCSDNEPPQALYRMSFLCRPDTTQNPFSHPKTVSDVPYGLTEEYIRRFQFGCYAGPDLIDSLHEYWFDWAGFNKHLYPHQSLFPWDCTEGLHRYPVKCGSCTLSKHLWAFLFDSWSIIALHLSRDRFSYPSESNPLPESSWLSNRLTDPATDRIKLGGINRAQPYGHALEHRTHDDFFGAKWVSSSYPSPVQCYEAMRDRWHMLRMVQEREGVSWSVEGREPPGEYATFPVEHWHVRPNENFVVSVSSTSGCGVCGTQAIAAACVANCGASCAGGGGGDSGGGGGGGGGVADGCGGSGSGGGCGGSGGG